MKTTLNFDAGKCYNYIESIEDFTIEFGSKLSYDDNETLMYIGEHIAVKSFLKTFMLRCKKESAATEEYDFVKWLRGRRLHWKMQQYRITGCLKDTLAALEDAEEKAVVEKKLKKYKCFFNHHYTLIDMMMADVMNNLPFSRPADNDRLQLKSSFDSLFNKGHSPEDYFTMLREHECPLLGVGYNYVSRALKSGFCIWVYELQRQHVIVHEPDKVYASLLLKKISGLKTFDHSLFRKTNNKAELLYKEYFERKIAEVKDLTTTNYK